MHWSPGAHKHTYGTLIPLCVSGLCVWSKNICIEFPGGFYAAVGGCYHSASIQHSINGIIIRRGVIIISITIIANSSRLFVLLHTYKSSNHRSSTLSVDRNSIQPILLTSDTGSHMSSVCSLIVQYYAHRLTAMPAPYYISTNNVTGIAVAAAIRRAHCVPRPQLISTLCHR